LLATGSNVDGIIRVWNIQSKTLITQLAGHHGRIGALAFSRNGEYLVSAGADSTIRTWVLATGVNDYSYSSYPAEHYSVAVSPDSRYIASGTADGALILWNARGAISSVAPQSLIQGTSTLRCYPTPSNSLVKIECELAQPGKVDLRIMDQLGREVAQLADGELQSGVHHFSWNAQALPAGIYHCRLQTATDRIVSQIVVVR
jgi:hypothetical protein